MSIEKREHYDPDPVVRSDEGTGFDIGTIIEKRMTRRDAMKATLGAMIAAGVGGSAFATSPNKTVKGLSFKGIQGNTDALPRLAEGYEHHVVLKWGQPILSGAPDFRPDAQSAVSQNGQFGYNADFVGFLSLPYGSNSSTHGLLGVNHEYTNYELMTPVENANELTKEQIDLMKSAVGFSVTEVILEEGRWTAVVPSRYNRRLTAESEFEITGPARRHVMMMTSEDPFARSIRGTFANCAAGKTPWGTVLSAEENFQDYFSNGNSITDPKLKQSHKRYGIPDGDSSYGFPQHDPRFDCSVEPKEPNRFGWVVEIDPFDPEWTPKKRTALGRCRHEAATTYVTQNDRLVMYSGDDARFEYVYKFVAERPYDKKNREANRDLLDKGILYVAKFNEDGTGEWLPLIHGQGPLTSQNGFDDQGDVVINVRTAADLLGATKMDRPEDIEVNPINEKVYVVCTNNTDRGKEGKAAPDKANPRPENRHGHIIELTEDNDDHAADRFRWELFLVCGDPKDPATFYAGYPKNEVAPISCPDNIAFDKFGNLWIATDGQTSSVKLNDGIFGVPTEGPERGKLKQFFSAVPGAEVCGPEFTPDNTTLFAAIQHPGEGSKFANPSTSWPEESGPPRPSVIAIRRKDGRPIGT